MSAIPNIWTEEAYLAFERSSEIRHEHLNGRIYAMTGGTPNHNLISGNAYASLHSQLRDQPNRVYGSDQRVKVKRTGLNTYPDISVVWDTPQFANDTLLNPIVLIEVLSPSTEAYDRGKKFQHYRELESLQEYILISQSSHRVERYSRQSDGKWVLSDVIGLDASLELPSIQCRLALADVYAKVTLEDENSESS
ncbi:MAG: Uma2 family endonuclease [Anaerolineae bacterium]|nr:Uma2 family endonuclease [Anaerolineae bacterium]